MAEITPLPDTHLWSLTGRTYKSADGNAIISVLTYPIHDLAGDYVRPDGGDWSKYPNHPVVNWAHGIPVGRGAVELKALEFDGKVTNVAVGYTQFYKSAADLDGIDRTEFDSPTTRKAIGQYSIADCLRAAEDAEQLVRQDIATGVSIEFSPKGQYGKAYWDLPEYSPLEKRQARHFEDWWGYGYAHARRPVNAGCRTLIDDGNEVIEKCLKVAETGRLPGGHELSPLIMKSFKDDSLVLPRRFVRGEYEQPAEVKADNEMVGVPHHLSVAASEASDEAFANGDPHSIQNTSYHRDVLKHSGAAEAAARRKDWSTATQHAVQSEDYHGRLASLHDATVQSGLPSLTEKMVVTHGKADSAHIKARDYFRGKGEEYAEKASGLTPDSTLHMTPAAPARGYTSGTERSGEVDREARTGGARKRSNEAASRLTQLYRRAIPDKYPLLQDVPDRQKADIGPFKRVARDDPHHYGLSLNAFSRSHSLLRSGIPASEWVDRLDAHAANPTAESHYSLAGEHRQAADHHTAELKKKGPDAELHRDAMYRHEAAAGLHARSAASLKPREDEIVPREGSEGNPEWVRMTPRKEDVYTPTPVAASKVPAGTPQPKPQMARSRVTKPVSAPTQPNASRPNPFFGERTGVAKIDSRAGDAHAMSLQANSLTQASGNEEAIKHSTNAVEGARRTLNGQSLGEHYEVIRHHELAEQAHRDKGEVIQADAHRKAAELRNRGIRYQQDPDVLDTSVTGPYGKKWKKTWEKTLSKNQDKYLSPEEISEFHKSSSATEEAYSLSRSAHALTGKTKNKNALVHSSGAMGSADDAMSGEEDTPSAHLNAANLHGLAEQAHSGTGEDSAALMHGMAKRAHQLAAKTATTNKSESDDDGDNDDSVDRARLSSHRAEEFERNGPTGEAHPETSEASFHARNAGYAQSDGHDSEAVDSLRQARGLHQSRFAFHSRQANLTGDQFHRTASALHSSADLAHQDAIRSVSRKPQMVESKSEVEIIDNVYEILDDNYPDEYETKSMDPKNVPSAGVRAVLNFAQFLMDGTDALLADSKRSDDINMRRLCKSVANKAQSWAAELATRAQEAKKQLDAADGDGTPNMGWADDTQAVSVEAKSMDRDEDGLMVLVKALYDEWEVRRYRPSNLKPIGHTTKAKPQVEVKAEPVAVSPPPPAPAPVVEQADPKEWEAIQKRLAVAKTKASQYDTALNGRR